MKIYHAAGTRSLRVVWLCEELGIEYELVRVDFSPEYRASAEWRAKNPVGKVPVLEIEGSTIFESGAMVEHILDRRGEGRLRPERGTREHALYLQWSWFAESTFARPIGEIVNHRRAFPGGDVSAVVEEMRGRAELCVEALEGALLGRSYLLSEFSAADVMMGYSLFLHRRFVTERLPPHVQAYWTRLGERPAFRTTFALDDAA